MSTKPWARILVGMAAAAAVAGSVLMPPPSSPAAAATPTDALVASTGENPCLTASYAVFRSLDCRGTVVLEFDVPSQVVAPVVSSDRLRNCHADPTNPSSPESTITTSVQVSSTESTSSSRNGARWVASSRGGTLAPAWGGTSIGGVSATRTVTEVTGWDQGLSNSLGVTYTLSTTATTKINPFHWVFWTYQPKYRQVEILWTWSEPTVAETRPGVRSSSIHTIRVPVFGGDVPQDTDGDGKVALTVAGGDLTDIQVPMSPAEVEACSNGTEPVKPTFEQPMLLRGVSGTASLETLPFLYTEAPPTSPVLRRWSGTGAQLQSRPAEPAKLLAGYGPSGPVFADPLRSSLQLVANSEVGFWAGGQCSTLTARVGYGSQPLITSNDGARDTVEVWSGELVNGQVEDDTKLAAVTVPAIRPGSTITDPSQLQVPLSVDVSKASILVLKVVAGARSLDSYSTSTPAVVIAEPTISCATTAPGAAFQRSAYVDPEGTATIDLAGTPEEIAADPSRFMQPSEVRYGWGACANLPAEHLRAQLPTIVNRSCGDRPLTIHGTVYDSGIGVHSGMAEGAVTTIAWDRVPATCTAISFAVGFDDHPGGVLYDHVVRVFSTLHNTRGGQSQWASPRQQVSSEIILSADGTHGAMPFSFDRLGYGLKRIEIVIDRVAHNSGGHVDIVNPVLTCATQGPTTSTLTYTPLPQLPDNTYEISKMEWARSSGFLYQIQRDASLGGRPVKPVAGASVMSTGGVWGWDSAIGMAPNAGPGEAQVDVVTAGRCERVSAWVGIDDAAGVSGSVIFKVYADGKLVAQSPIKRGGQKPTFLEADLSGALVVTLAANNVENNEWDHANWGDPVLTCSSRPQSAYTKSVANAPFISEWNGHGPVERNMSLGEVPARDGRPISIAGYSGWTSAIGMAPGVYESARVTVSVAGCSYFTSWVGIDDETGGRGTAQFSVLVDGAYRHGSEVHVSPVMRGGQPPHFLRIDVRGAQTIELVVAGIDGNAYDHADWANPTLYCG